MSLERGRLASTPVRQEIYDPTGDQRFVLRANLAMAAITEASALFYLAYDYKAAALGFAALTGFSLFHAGYRLGRMVREVPSPKQ